MNFFQKGDYKKVVWVSLPLVLSMGSTTIMEFTDRIFLGNYSLDSIAAALPAGITSFLFTSFFLGVTGYVNVFVAQYTGAKNPEGVGASVWQGIYFAILGGIIMALLSFFAEPFFRFIGHSAHVQRLEIIYFKILCLGAWINLLGACFSGFFSGRGVTAPILAVHFLGMLINIPLDYCMINGISFFPEMGIKGAALATLFSWGFISFVLFISVFSKKNIRKYSLIKKRYFEPTLFMNLMKFGIPSGVQFFLEILAFTFFVLIVGRLGREELAVSNIVLSINSLAYMPMFGFSMGLSTLVGQALGKDRPDLAEKSTIETTQIAVVYIILLGVFFLFRPEPLINLFLPLDISNELSVSVIKSGTVLLRFVTLYLIFDSLSVIFTGSLKGAGDTAFIMVVFGAASFFFLFLPIYTGIIFFNQGLYYSWSCLTFYIILIFSLIFGRYLSGNWKGIQVIEKNIR